MSSRPTKSELDARARALFNKGCPRLPTGKPANAYGIYLTDKCLLRFGPGMRKRIDPAFDPKNHNQLATAKFLAAKELPQICLIFVPGLWLTRWTSYLARTDGGRIRYLLVMADDSSEEAMAIQNSRDVVERVREILGFGDQEPKWYPIVSWPNS